AGGDPDRDALEVVSTILSGMGGRLFTELRDKRSMAYSVTSMAVEGLDPGYFATYIGTSPDKKDAAEAAREVELQRLVDTPVTAAELDRAREHLVGPHEIGLQRNAARAMLLALDTAYGLGLDNFEHYDDRVWAVTAADLQRVAARVRRRDQSAPPARAPCT